MADLYICISLDIGKLTWIYAAAGGGYAIFAGREVARALGIMSLEEKDCTDDLSGLTEKQLGTLQEWEDKFKTKYEIVGRVRRSFLKELKCMRADRSKLWLLERCCWFHGVVNWKAQQHPPKYWIFKACLSVTCKCGVNDHKSSSFLMLKLNPWYL